MVDIGKIFENKDLLKQTICEMQKTVLMDSETTSKRFSQDWFKRWMNNDLS